MSFQRAVQPQQRQTNPIPAPSAAPSASQLGPTQLPQPAPAPPQPAPQQAPAPNQQQAAAAAQQQPPPAQQAQNFATAQPDRYGGAGPFGASIGQVHPVHAFHDMVNHPHGQAMLASMGYQKVNPPTPTNAPGYVGPQAQQYMQRMQRR